jgi:hypothetical protein
VNEKDAQELGCEWVTPLNLHGYLIFTGNEDLTDNRRYKNKRYQDVYINLRLTQHHLHSSS